MWVSMIRLLLFHGLRLIHILVSCPLNWILNIFCSLWLFWDKEDQATATHDIHIEILSCILNGIACKENPEI